VQQKTVVTESQYQKLDALLREAATIDADEKRLSEKKDANRAALAELIKTAELVNADNRTACAGVVVQSKQSVKFDPDSALAWALAPENFPAATPLLQVRQDSISTLVGLAMQDPNLKSVFELNKAGYESAVRGKTHVGMPPAEIEDKEVIAITMKALKLGDELRAQFEVIPDPEPEQPIDFESIKPIEF